MWRQVNRLAGMAIMLHCLLPTSWVPPLSPPTAQPLLGTSSPHLRQVLLEADLHHHAAGRHCSVHAVYKTANCRTISDMLGLCQLGMEL